MNPIMLTPPKKRPLAPSTQFHLDGEAPPTNFTVCDFWKWAFSDLQQNAVRGILTEFIVAKALDVDLVVRESWADFDLETRDGIKIEVKTSAYLQGWEQKRPSTITFSGLKGRTWSPTDGYAIDPTYRADVFVFCIQTAKTHEEYDPLDLAQWEFRVVPRLVIEGHGTNSIAYSVL